MGFTDEEAFARCRNCGSGKVAKSEAKARGLESVREMQERKARARAVGRSGGGRAGREAPCGAVCFFAVGARCTLPRARQIVRVPKRRDAPGCSGTRLTQGEAERASAAPSRPFRTPAGGFLSKSLTSLFLIKLIRLFSSFGPVPHSIAQSVFLMLLSCSYRLCYSVSFRTKSRLL